MTKKTKIIAGIVTAILLLGGGVVYAINRKKKDPNAPVKENPQ